ncbi:hypothetical protein [Streptomyces sp. NPDC058755]|uniref:hypothetical protein n=1 Tax=Streptomyces sp. NPDC058755 TaxID=3346624 RepID=UPI0036CE3F4D
MAHTWRDDGTDQTIHDLLRWQVREKARRMADPSLVVLDAQSVHAAAGVPEQSTGRDARSRILRPVLFGSTSCQAVCSADPAWVRVGGAAGVGEGQEAT